MYAVSEAFKTALDHDLREPSYIQIKFGVTNVDAPLSSTIADNGHLSYSDVSNIDMGATQPLTYQTLELNRFVLDGVNPLPVMSNPSYQGYCSNVMTDKDGNFEASQSIVIDFDDYFEFPALSFIFDTGKNEYPAEMRIIAYHDGETVLDEYVYPNSPTWTFNSHIPVCNRLRFIITSMNKGYRRARLTELIYGIQQTFGNDDIVSCDFSQNLSIDSTELSGTDFSFTVMDTEHAYDPENPQGVWEYLEQRQFVQVRIGQTLDNDTVEYIPLCSVYTTGDFSVSGQESLTNITVSCNGLINQLTDPYTKGTFAPNGRTFYQLVRDIADETEFGSIIEADNALMNYSTHLPLPVMPVNELLQLIANATCSVITQTRGGGIRIEPIDSESTDFYMNFDKMYNAPTSTKIVQLRNLTSVYYQYAIEETSEIAKLDIDVDSSTKFTITHDAATNISVVGASGVTINSYTAYAYQTIVVATGTGKITVNGQKITTTEAESTMHFSDVGEDLTGVSNQLIDNYNHLQTYMAWLGNCTRRRTTYEAENRGYPYLDASDNIQIDSNFKTAVDGTIINNQLSFDGGISGKVTVLTAEVS